LGIGNLETGGSVHILLFFAARSEKNRGCFDTEAASRSFPHRTDQGSRFVAARALTA
jgi:hypothetical protein